MELFKLFGTIAIKNTEANEQIDDTTDRAKDSEGQISNAFKKIGAAVGTYFAVDKIKQFGENCINAAADANAASSQFTQVFGEMESQAKQSLTGIADNTGIQVNRMKGSYTQIAAFAKTTGMETSDALSLADRAMIAVADSAAFYDRSLEDTTESLQSFLKGNYENDSALGLSCTEVTRNEAANRLYGKSFKDLAEDQKQLTLLQMVEDANQLSGALGQAARESDTWSNQTGNLKQAWNDMLGVLGQYVLPTAIEWVKKGALAVQELSGKMPEIIQTFKDWSPLIVAVIAGFTALKGALAISAIINAVTKSWTAYKLANEGATVAQWLLNKAMLANPITIIVALIAGLVAAIIYLWNTNDDFRKKVIEIWNNVKSAVSGAINNIKSVITSGISSAYSAVTSKLNAIKEKFSSIFNSAKNVVQSAIGKIKSVMNFSWSLPKLKLPHPKITGKFSLNPPSVPRFSIQWYKKAMDEPYMMTEPTVFGMNPSAGTLKAGGEAGDEMIYGKSNLLKDIREAVGMELGDTSYKLDKLIQLLDHYFPLIIANLARKLYLDGDVLVGELLDRIDKELGDKRLLTERGM